MVAAEQLKMMAGVWRLIVRNKMFLLLLFTCVLVANIAYRKLPVKQQLLKEDTSVPKSNSSMMNATSEASSWLTYRKDYLRRNKAIKVFLFAYMRGGSSVAGELFNCDPKATMWYEPGDAFFSSYYGLLIENLPQNDLYFSNMTRRKLDAGELEAMFDFYNATLACDYERLPAEAMAHYFLTESTAMDGYVNCMRGRRTKNIDVNRCKVHISSICGTRLVETSLRAKCHVAISVVKRVLRNHPSVRKDTELVTLLRGFLDEQSIVLPSGGDAGSLLRFVRHGLCIETMRRDNEKCLGVAKKRCRNDNLRVLQVLRMKMEDLEPLVRTNPDIYVIHYTRDPRAIALSRVQTGTLTFDKSNRSIVREAQLICHKMREDMKARLRLEHKYPGVFTHLTYESLATDPEDAARRFYETFNGTYSKTWRKFIAQNMHGQGESAGFGITVRNATATAFRWKSKISHIELVKIGSFCADVIIGLGYEL